MTSSTRRTFLGGLATATLTGLAGCVSGTDEPLAPSVPTQQLKQGGWRHVDDFEDRLQRTVEFKGIETTVSVHGKGTVYRNDGPRQRLAEQFAIPAEQLSFPAKAYAAAKARTDPSIGMLAKVTNPTERIINEAEPRIKEQLRGMGFSNIRRTFQGELEVETGETAEQYRYEMEYEYGPLGFEYQGVPVRLEQGVFPVETQFAMWIHNGLIALAGGVYPGGDVTATIVSDERDVSRDVPVSFEVEAFREEMEVLIIPVS